MREVRDRKHSDSDASWERVEGETYLLLCFPIGLAKEGAWIEEKKPKNICLVVQSVVCDGSSHLS